MIQYEREQFNIQKVRKQLLERSEEDLVKIP